MVVLATSMLMIDNKTEEKLELVPSIQCFVTFKDQLEALLDSGSKVNAMSQVFAHQFGLKTWKTNIKVQKIDGTTLKIYKMVVSIFSMLDKDSRRTFFEKNFLLADVKPDEVLGMPFLTISNADIDFQALDL